MGPIGFQEMILIFVVALLVFGPKKLPELGKSFGKGIAEFRKASGELRATFQREMDNIEQETKEVRKVADDVKKDVKASYYEDRGDYSSDYDEEPYDTGTKEAAKTSAAPSEKPAATKTDAESSAGANGTVTPPGKSATTDASQVKAS